jgi:hypothetical protein
VAHDDIHARKEKERRPGEKKRDHREESREDGRSAEHAQA